MNFNAFALTPHYVVRIVNLAKFYCEKRNLQKKTFEIVSEKVMKNEFFKNALTNFINKDTELDKGQ